MENDNAVIFESYQAAETFMKDCEMVGFYIKRDKFDRFIIVNDETDIPICYDDLMIGD